MHLRTGGEVGAHARTGRAKMCASYDRWSWGREGLGIWDYQIQTNIERIYAAATAAKSLQSCLTLCDPIDGSPPGPAVPGILQARTMEWVAISFSNA